MLRLKGLLIPRHDHGHMHMPDGAAVTGEPLDAIMYMHILIMGFTFGVVFPTGMVLGLTRNKWHVPVQILGGCMAIVGYFLGHAHGGRQFAENAHSKFANWVMLTAIFQVSVGVILKLHIERGFLGKVRNLLVKVHLVVALLFPIVSWVQMVFGAIAIPGFCLSEGDHVGQCLAHEIMGSSFIWYGIYYTTMLFVGAKWLASRNACQEFYDSAVIAAWGLVNTFTEHRWGSDWSMKDFEHTSMGWIWFFAGLVGVYLSHDRVNDRPRRNHIPALVMMFTGYAMANHHQSLEVSEKVHTFFGYMLMLAGLTRIIEVSFVLHDAPHSNTTIKSFQYLTPFLLIESGIMFMGGTEEQMEFLDSAGIMHGAYILVMSGFAFMIFLLAVFLNNLYLATRDRSSPSYSAPQSAPYPGVTGVGQRSSGEIEMEPFLSEDDNDETDRALHRPA